MEQKQIGRYRRYYTAFLWPIRLVLFAGAFYISWFVIYLHLPVYLGLPLGGVVAALTLALEVYITARLRHRPFRQVALWRLMVLDHLLSRGSEDSLSNQARQGQFAPAKEPRALLDEGEIIEAEAWEE
jgi:hypothetical protein